MNESSNVENEETIGQRIAFYRKKRGFTQQKLADIINIDRTAIANYERGRIRIYDDVVAKLSIALNVSADVLLGIKDLIGKEQAYSLRITKRIQRIEELSPAQQKIILRNIDLNIAGMEKEDTAK